MVFQKAATEKWADRTITSHLERVYGDLGAKDALERPMAKRIRQLFDAVVSSG